MASGSFALTRTGGTSTYITFKCAWTSTSNGTAANSSTVKVTVTASKSSSSTASTYGSQTTTATVDGSAQSNSGSFTLAPGKTITLLTKSYTVKHNANGSKSCTISVNVGGNIIYANGSATVTLDTIPQYATVTQTLSSKTETTAVMKWSSDSTIDYIWYSTNNGSSWTGINVADGTNGIYTISGLAANTTYQVKTRVRRKDSQRTTDSSALSVTTYNYPYANSMPNFTIGEKLTLGFYNPLNRSITVNILGADGSQISNDTTTETTISGYNGAVVVGRLYESIPNAKSGAYKVKVTYNGQSNTKNGGTYTINQNVCKPSVTSVTYQDTNATTTAITENNQLIIQNQSVATFTTTLVTNNSATVKTAVLSVNGNTYNMTVSGTTGTAANIQIDSAINVTATVTLTDSRGLTATKSTTVQMLAWSMPTALIDLHRLNNYYDTTYLTVNADYSSVDGKNTIAIQYRYQEAGNTGWSEWASIQDNVQATMTLDRESEWTVQVQLKDLFGTTTYNVPLAKGIPIVFFDRLKNSTGFNCFPQDEESVESLGLNLNPSVATMGLGESITNVTTGSYVKIPLDLPNVTGTKLTTTSDGGIKIGAGVTKVLVSGRISIKSGATVGSRHMRIVRNTYSAANTLGWCDNQFLANTQGNVIVTPIMADVQKNDVIYLFGYFMDSADQVGGGSANQYGGRTSFTVQVVG